MGYINSLESGRDGSYNTMFELYEIELKLTNLGMKNWKEVNAMLFDFIEFLIEELKTNPEDFHLLREIKKMSKLSFKFWTSPDPMDYVTSLADKMAEIGDDTDRLSKIIKETRREIEHVNIPEIISILEYLKYEKAKILVGSSTMMSNPVFTDLKKGDIHEEEYMKV